MVMLKGGFRMNSSEPFSSTTTQMVTNRPFMCIYDSHNQSASCLQI